MVVVDLGGTLIRAALANQDAVLSRLVRQETNANHGAETVVSRIFDAIRDVAARDAIQAIGLGAPGPLDSWRGVILSAPNLPGIIDFPMKARLEKEFNVPVFIGNDANLAALGEHRYGAGHGTANMIYMTISTGIGGGIIAENNLFLGSRGFAGEIGHQTLEARGARCNCGNVGCLEVLASGPAIARSALEALKSGRASKLRELASVDARAVTNAARDGDALALETLKRAGYYIGLGIVNLLHAFDTSLFVIGGGVAVHAWDLLYPSMLAVLDRHAMPAMRGGVRVVQAELGEESGLKGAVALVLDRITLNR